MIALLTIACLAIPLGKGDSISKAQRAERLLHETLAARDSLPQAGFIQNLEQVTRWDRRNAEGFHQLGLAWAKKGTLQARTHALTALERAVALEPRNTSFRYALAQLHLQRDFDGSARDEFKKIMKLDPADARSYYHLALFEEEGMLRNRDKVSFHENATISFYSFAVEDYLEAERLLRTAVALDPLLLGAYYHLAGLYFEAQRFQEMSDLLQDAITINADRHATSEENTLLPQSGLVDIFLLQGLTYTRLSQMEQAQQSYDRAFVQMSPDERDLFYSLSTVLAPDSLRFYMQLKADPRVQMAARFWQARDPLFLTTVNERLLEHFSRIAYANLRFSLPLKGISGWKTDRGRTLIRFGFPRGRLRTPADLGSTLSGRTTVVSSKEMWDYGDFYMFYEDRGMNQNYSFAWSFDPNLDGKNLFENQIEKEPERFDFPHGGQRLDLPHVIAQFRASSREGEPSDSTLLEIYYGLNTAEIRSRDARDTTQSFVLQRGLFLCDANWHPIVQRREQRRLRYTGDDGEESLLLERWTLPAAAGRFNLSLEVQDQESGHTGAEREAIMVEKFSSDLLQMSSILLARQVTEAQPGLVLYQKGEVNIIPSLSHVFETGAPIFVYYEVYNLAVDESGGSYFRVENKVEPVPVRSNLLAGAVKTFSRWLGAGEKSVAITSSFETRGTVTEERLYHGIELTGAEAGGYRLTITVLDLRSQQRASRSLDFSLQEPSAKKRLHPAR
ncbi:MAG: GWxTD domain-containing protein [bacterium]